MEKPIFPANNFQIKFQDMQEFYGLKLISTHLILKK